jgi:uncharacterized alpha/beta hydrolase family protein
MAMKTKGDLRTIETDWEKIIVKTIYEKFSNKHFCVYDIAMQIMNRKEAENKSEFFKWLQRVRKTFKDLEALGKIQFIGYSSGRGPIMKKLYRVVSV